MALLFTVLTWIGLILPILTFCNGCSQHQTTVIEQHRGPIGFQNPVLIQPPVVLRPPVYFNFGGIGIHRSWGHEYHTGYHQPFHEPIHHEPIHHGGHR